jgi:hypothetical protein
MGMGQVHSISDSGPWFDEPHTIAQQALLKRAVAKLVLIGELVGVSTDQMILLLESGLTVGELLDYLALKSGEIS